jgi:hypothetical protein
MRKNYGGKKVSVKSLVTGIIIFVLAASTVALAFALNNAVKTKTVSTFAYSVGSINEKGNIELTDGSLYTDYMKADGLEIEVAEDADVTYKVFFYEKDKTFISATESLSDDFDNTTIPEKAEYCRVMITPINDDGIITASEKSEYSSELIITVKR